jgi:hypothetical protein
MHNISINQTLIKEVENATACPRKIYVMHIAATHPREVTLSMLKGSYFETQVLGEDCFEEEKRIKDLPRKRNGEPTIDQARIDLQVREFPEALKKYGLRKPKPNGRQIKMSVQLGGITCHGTYDFVTAMESKDYGSHPVVIVDLKLTKDRDSTFGNFCWGTPENIDQLQGQMYPMLFKEFYKAQLPKDYVPPFFYLIFDYKPQFGHKLIPVTYDAYYEDQVMERIRFTHEKLQSFVDSDFPEEPEYEACKTCPLAKLGQCKSAPLITDVQEIENDEVFNPFT